MVSKFKIPKEEKIEKAIRCLNEKGAIEIIHCLEEGGTLRFNEVKHRLVGVSPRTLAKRLKQLEKIQLINRKAYAEIPPRVEYSLTDRGEKLASILNQAWKLFEEWYL